MVHLDARYGSLLRCTQVTTSLHGPRTCEEILTCKRDSAAGEHYDLWSHLLSWQIRIPTQSPDTPRLYPRWESWSHCELLLGIFPCSNAALKKFFKGDYLSLPFKLFILIDIFYCICKYTYILNFIFIYLF